jgi:hypothetical protein
MHPLIKSMTISPLLPPSPSPLSRPPYQIRSLWARSWKAQFVAERSQPAMRHFFEDIREALNPKVRPPYYRWRMVIETVSSQEVYFMLSNPHTMIG